MKETDLFDPIRFWLEDGGYRVHSEVDARYVGGRPDIVGVHGSVLTVVELKTSLSLELIEQAVRWQPHANLIYIGIPKRKYIISGFVARLMHSEGIGVIEVEKSQVAGAPPYWALCRTKPRLNRRVLPHLRNGLGDFNLADNHIKGGTQGGGYSTEYSRTIERLRSVIGSNWMSIAQILDRVNHDTHWSAPKTSMAQALRSFETDWCECQKIDGRLMFRRKREVVAG